MERELLLLGLLRSHEMHGYQLNELIDSHLGTSVQLKKPTAYRLLNQMAEEGWITHREEREGNRPPRRVYTITSEGETAFQQILRESLADYKPAEFRSDIGLAFLDALPTEEALPLLHKRRAIIEDQLQTMSTDDKHHGAFQLVIEHQVRHLSTELEWLDEIIDRMEQPESDVTDKGDELL
jgi:DNA-binding PadR family transcriptional regulator